MQSSIYLVLPLALIGLAGYASTRFGLLRPGATDGIARLVVSVAVPLLVFRVMARTTLPKDLTNMGELALSYFGGALAAYLVSMMVAKYAFSASKIRQHTYGISTANANVVLLGIPAVLLVLGTKQTLPLIVIIGIHSLVMTIMVSLIAGFVHSSRQETLKDVLVAQLFHPILLAVVAGIVYRQLELPLSGPFDKSIRLLGDAALPCGLFAVGGMLVRYPIGAVTKESLGVSVLKLAVHPLLVWVLAQKVFTLPTSWVWVAVMLAAMPIAVNMGDSRRGDDGPAEDAGQATSQSTALAVVTVTLLVYLIQRG